ncbi:MAG: Gfo/Idh/MocA family oxidoreductase, partial [Armatimonadetes bacterium]|nr:Gfo/Idh/MocA family oxidoreductase [Armatimonadota bacterium]
MLRIAMLSFAHVHAEGYANQVKDSKEAEIAVIWDDDESRGKAAADRHGVPFTTDLDAVLGDRAIDGIVSNAETSKHRDLFLKVAAAKKHLFTEKALTITTAEADEVIPAV